MRNYYNLQWRKPFRFLYKGYGIWIWKWCGIYFPTFAIRLGYHRGLSYEILDYGMDYRGVGFRLELSRDSCINFLPSKVFSGDSIKIIKLK